jgi:hypothetical protein
VAEDQVQIDGPESDEGRGKNSHTAFMTATACSTGAGRKCVRHWRRPMPDLSLVPTRDLMEALKARCDALVIVMEQDPGKHVSTADMPYMIHGARTTCIGLAAQIMVLLSTASFEVDPP